MCPYVYQSHILNNFRLEKPVGYPDDPNTHHIANFYPQDIEQPVEIAFYDKNG